MDKESFEQEQETPDEQRALEHEPTIEKLEAEWAALSCDCEWG